MRPITSLLGLVALFATGTAHAQSSTQPVASAEEPSNEASATDEDAADAPRVQLEDPEPSQGHFLAMGVYGLGAMAFDDSRGTRTPTFGEGFSLRLGESLTDWVDLGLAFALGSTSGAPQNSLTLGRFGVTSQWYPTDRLFVQAGFGATYTRGKDPEDHALNNLYLSDADQSGGWVFTPVATAEIGPNSNFTSTALWLGVEISWWSGLTRDKLNLPFDKAYER
jgi:hypothetical protein